MDIDIDSERSEQNGHSFTSINGIKQLNYGSIKFNDGKSLILTKLVASGMKIVGEENSQDALRVVSHLVEGCNISS